MFDDGWEAHDFCYLTTRGRVSGKPHRIEIWFAGAGGTLYLLAGDGARSDWVRNLIADPSTTVQIGSVTLPAVARVVDDTAEAATARRLVAQKYASHEAGLDEWSLTALPVAIEPATDRP
jgi:deazaflavin-dependent oxidoreductase (nitroreductase family)